MSVEMAQWLVAGFGIYVLLGFIVAVMFIAGGVGRIDPAARGTGMRWSVRLLVAPGIVGLWPIMLVKWFTQTEPPIQ
ncbi:MAG: hypothetical protein AAF265_05250 [Pseudomonadota bacterium]